jgi:uncharacterized RDD family membrane protein YckC
MWCDCGYDFQHRVFRNDNAKPNRVVLATLGERFVGQLIDEFVACMGLIAGLVVGLINEDLGLLIMIPGYLFLILYLFLADGLENGQSIGKKVMKISVVDTRTGVPCTFGQSFIRNVVLMLGIIDWIFIFGEKRQRLGDKAANTMVIAVL